MAFPFATISKRRFVASQHIVFCSHRDRYHGTSVRGLIRVRCTRSRRRAPGFRTVPSHPPSCHSVTYFQTTSTLWPPAVERHQREHNATTRHSVCTFQPDSALFLAFVWLVGRHFADLVARHSHTHPYTHPPPEKKKTVSFLLRLLLSRLSDYAYIQPNIALRQRIKRRTQTTRRSRGVALSDLEIYRTLPVDAIDGVP